jgi:phosphoribosylformylglycinamidine cyclo-ligase
MVTYRDSGVDIDAGDKAVDLMAHHVRSTHTPQVLPASHGGFAGLFLLDYPKGVLQRNYRNPVLVACTDGVGTKLEVAIRMEIAETIGIDLVAMCVNDLIVQGADPLFFLDYIAVGRLKPAQIASIVKGIAAGCREAGCALLGGETAEMPGFYPDGHYDVAGFAVGVAERSRLILGQHVTAGDVLIGLHSSGVHSNGYSLVRRIFLNDSWNLSDVPPGLEEPLGQALLRPTLIYVKTVQAILRAYRTKRVVHAMAHITGSGLPGNVPRVLPRNVDAVIRLGSWEPPPLFRLIEEAGKVPAREMYRVFNMGIGMVLVVSRFFAESILAQLENLKVPASRIGEIVRGKGRVILKRR